LTLAICSKNVIKQELLSALLWQMNFDRHVTAAAIDQTTDHDRLVDWD
jgi:hypothetical protein